MAESKQEMTPSPESLEDAFEQLNELVALLERDDNSLEECFNAYEQGMKLIKYCNGEIDQVEKKVLKIGEDGELHEF